MPLLLHGDCLEQLKVVDDNSVDLIFCDLPYGQTSCKWDIIIPWKPLWDELLRVKKLNTPIFFTTTTKFGVELINNAPKKCPFRWDMVWVKSAPAGFLSAKKMPMRKHEMVYCFYEKLPFYDLSSHKHKFKKANIKNEPTNKKEDDLYGIESGNAGRKKGFHQTSYDPPLPTSVVKEEKMIKEGQIYNGGKAMPCCDMRGGKEGGHYDPPLPTSVVKEEKYIPPAERKNASDPNEGATMINGTLGGAYDSRWQKGHQGNSYDPPLPNSILEVKSTRGKHSTEKPVALMEWILKYFSKEGDVVLDPTMGSGSTGVACKNMNREFIGIEQNDEFYELCCERLE